MTINYQRRDFLRRACYVGLSVGLPKPVLAAMGTTAEAASEQLARQYRLVSFPPTFTFYQPGDPVSFAPQHRTTMQYSDDDGETWHSELEHVEY